MITQENIPYTADEIRGMKEMNNKEFLTREQIKQKLTGMVVGEYLPIKLVHIITPNPEYDSQFPMEKVYPYKLWCNALAQQCVKQNDGTYNYYSEDNIDAIIKFGELHGGGVINFC